MVSVGRSVGGCECASASCAAIIDPVLFPVSLSLSPSLLSSFSKAGILSSGQTEREREREKEGLPLEWFMSESSQLKAEVYLLK